MLWITVPCVLFEFILSSVCGDLPGLTPDSEFQGVTPPEWVLEGAVKVFLPLDDTDAIERAADLGATIIHAGGPSLYYPLRRDQASSGVAEPERSKLLHGIEVAKKRGMRVVLGISPYAPIEIVREHPEWVHLPTDDPSYASQALGDLTRPENIGLRSLPLNSPYGEYAIDGLIEILNDFQVDGFSFDGCYHHPINFSPLERELYQKDLGRPFPTKIDLNDEDYRIYLLWADEKLEGWYRKLGQRMKEVKPDAAIYTWTTNAGRYGHFLTSPRVMSARLNRLIDCPVQEWWLDEVNQGSTVVPNFGAAYVRAVSGGVVGASEPYLMSHGNPYTTDSFPAHELEVRCLGAMTNGSFTPLAQMSGKAAMETTLSEIARRKETFTHLRQEPWAALLVSEQTRQFYAHGNIMERWLSHALGFYRMGMEEHLPITLITELELRSEVLSQYRVLLLPNVACLSDKQCQTIRDYVREGGGLVATCETSLFDDLGRPRGDFALRDVFGAGYGGRSVQSTAKPEIDANFAIVVNDQYWAQRGNVGALRFGDFSDSLFATDPRFQALVPNGQATFKGPMIRPTPFASSMKPAMLYFPEGSRDAFPAAATGEYGEGRVVYLAAGLDAALFSYGFPYQRVLLARATRWAAKTDYPISVVAPMCVQSTFWKKSDGRIVVHLWNGINTTSDHGQQDAEVPLREESIPIHGIRINVHRGSVDRARIEPQGIALPIQHQEGMTILELPPIEVHSAVVLEIQEAP
ncbi:MAG: alpha-amylase family protein [Planctomycetota bacterium]